MGPLILFVAATALGRLGVISVRDVEAARRRDAEETARQETRQTATYPPVTNEPVVRPAHTTPATVGTESGPTRTESDVVGSARTGPDTGTAHTRAADTGTVDARTADTRNTVRDLPPTGGSTSLDADR